MTGIGAYVRKLDHIGVATAATPEAVTSFAGYSAEP